MSAYLCSDDNLNALSTFYYMKSGKTDEERKCHVMRAIRSVEKDRWYETQETMKSVPTDTFEAVSYTHLTLPTTTIV